MKYNDSKFFNTDDTYLFLSPFNFEFESKVEYYNGAYYTTNKKYSSYKATTLLCKKLSLSKEV